MAAKENIVSAFRDLVLSRRYDDFTVNEVIDHSGVARSTFYQHFKSKNDLLIQSMDPILDVLGDLVRRQTKPVELDEVLQHIWENRQLGRVFFEPPLNDRLADGLIDKVKRTGSQDVFCIAGLLAVLRQWVNGRLSLTPSELGLQLETLVCGLRVKEPFDT